MTGRNHTSNGMACITEATSGFPNANGHIPFENANIAEVLSERGWNTYIVGKWHLCAEDEMNLASSKPTGTRTCSTWATRLIGSSSSGRKWKHCHGVDSLVGKV